MKQLLGPNSLYCPNDCDKNKQKASLLNPPPEEKTVTVWYYKSKNIGKNFPLFETSLIAKLCPTNHAQCWFFYGTEAAVLKKHPRLPTFYCVFNKEDVEKIDTPMPNYKVKADAKIIKTNWKP
jgi:hypothetical protein